MEIIADWIRYFDFKYANKDARSIISNRAAEEQSMFNSVVLFDRMQQRS